MTIIGATQYLVFLETLAFLLIVTNQPWDGASSALFTQSLQTQTPLFLHPVNSLLLWESFSQLPQATLLTETL